VSRKTRKALASNLQLFVAHPGTIATKCQMILQSLLKNKEIQVVARHEGDKVHYEVQAGNGISEVTADKNTYWIVPLIFSNEGTQYWLNFSLTFIKIEEKSSFIFAGTSLRVFKGLLTQQKEICFRAEWGSPKQNDSHHHPHWHIYPEQRYYLNNTPLAKDFVSMIQQEKETSEFVKTVVGENGEVSGAEEVKIDLSYFHFAMSSQWHLGENSPIAVKEEYFPKWLNGALQYIISQLEYLSKKSST